MVAERRSFSDQAAARDGGAIEVRVRDLEQLFHSMDPSPFGRQHLDPDVEEYIVGRARELPAGMPAELVLHLRQQQSGSDSVDWPMVEEAIHLHFAERARRSWRRLRELLHRGWISLAIGLTLLLASVVVGETVARRLGQGPLPTVLRESLLIGGWVAMSRPVEIFLYDWWALRRERRGYDRLSRMSVRLVGRDPQSTPAARVAEGRGAGNRNVPASANGLEMAG